MGKFVQSLCVTGCIIFTGCGKKTPAPISADAEPVEASQGPQVLPPYHSLDISIGGTVTVSTGTDYKVDVNASEEIRNNIGVSVEQGTLRLQWRPNTMIPSKNPPRVRITCPELQNLKMIGGSLTAERVQGTRIFIEASGLAEIHIGSVVARHVELLTGNASEKIEIQKLETDSFRATDKSQLTVELEGGYIGSFSSRMENNRVTLQGQGGNLKARLESIKELHAQGTFARATLEMSASTITNLQGTYGLVDGSVAAAGKLNIDGTLEAVDMKVENGGTVEAKGTARVANWSADNSGEILAQELETDTVTVTNKSNGTVKVWAKDLLTATVEKASSVLTYRGNPQVQKNEIQGGKVLPE